jgi:hypothetical protein
LNNNQVFKLEARSIIANLELSVFVSGKSIQMIRSSDEGTKMKRAAWLLLLLGKMEANFFPHFAKHSLVPPTTTAMQNPLAQTSTVQFSRRNAFATIIPSPARRCAYRGPFSWGLGSATRVPAAGFMNSRVFRTRSAQLCSAAFR